jgi:phosphoglycolate phosphatase-like HAD superfamily hydrolase
MPFLDSAMSDAAGPAWLEIVHSNHARGPFRCVVFDFDGTLSLLRGNWQGLMVPMMVQTLLATGTGESEVALTALVEEYVTRLTGQPTMQQILALVSEVVKRGGARPDPDAHLAYYLDQLLSRTQARIDAVRAGRTTPDEMLVPGAGRLVEQLHRRGLILVIASGTELTHVRSEAGVLGLNRFFGDRMFGPIENDPRFSKEAVLRSLMAEHGLRGSEIVAIGDGPAEMLAVKSVGGLALGVASDEVTMSGRINPLKREHLLRAGADVIIPDYRQLHLLLQLLTPGPWPLAPGH